MKLHIADSYERASGLAAAEVCRLVQAQPEAVLCFAAGDTPRLAYSLIVQKAREEQIDFSRITFIGLDEWVGIPPENEGSCHYFLQENLIRPLGLMPAQVHLFDALSRDLSAETERLNQAVAHAGGLDLILVGIGMNGHIGFNEPGIPFDSYAHVVELEAFTQEVGQKYFRTQTVLNQGITLGLRHLTEAKQAILIANGLKKAEIVRQAIEGPVSPDVPASVMRLHPGGLFLIEREAASALHSSPA
ncbi:MAG: glucosamine-6-phosphate deaminase [Bacteroidetes bacterium]|nr:MAG: glucosamine-6-phosphate deaminase [Bacteroidota bacterium]